MRMTNCTPGPPARHARTLMRMANCTPGPPAWHARLLRRNLAQSGAIGNHRRSQERGERQAAAAMANVEKAAVVTCIGECQRGVGGGRGGGRAQHAARLVCIIVHNCTCVWQHSVAR